MGIISVEKVDNLIWLGRYSERVYITIKEFFSGYDKMLENPQFYINYCQNMQIPCIYQDSKDFIQHYIKDEKDINSIIANLYRGYDNCIVLRNEISSECVSYLELALNDLKHINDYHSFIIDLQFVLDHILAFWASLEENVQDYEVRSMIKLGKRIECLDMYLRLRRSKQEIKKAYAMLENRLHKNYLPYDLKQLTQLKQCIEQEEISYESAINCVESLIE